MGAITTTPRTINAEISPDTDVDLYRFTVTAGKVVDLDIDTSLNGPGGLGSFLRLFNSQGQELDFNNDAAAPGENAVGFDAYLRFTFSTAGTFYLGVSNANNTLYQPLTGDGDVAGGQHSIGSYQLILQALPVDTDDSLGEATSLGVISTTAKKIDAGIAPDIDVDLYRFTVTAGRVVDFDVDTPRNGPGGLGSFLRLFDALGQELDFNNDAAAPGENTVGFDAYLRFTFSTAGTYYVGVSNANNTLYDPVTGSGDAAGGQHSIGSYQLIVQALPVDTDDSLSEATFLGSISTTPKTANAAINPDIDVDLYRFTVTAGRVVDFDIDTPLNGPGGLGSFLRLFNAQGQELAFNNDAAAPGENTVGFDAYLRFTFAAAGTFYIGMSNANNTLYDPLTGNGDAAGGQNSIGSYQLTVQTAPADPGDTDDSLNEATFLGAISTTPNTTNAEITPDIDVDLYRFTVTAGQAVDFDIDTPLNGPGGLGSFLRLFDAQGQELAVNDNAAAPGENTVGFDAYLRFTFATAGTYYVGVSNANNTLYDPVTGTGDVAGGPNSTGSYQLIVQALPVDTDDSLNEATFLGAISTIPNTTNAEITPDIDVDVYRFTVTANQTVDFDIDTPLNGPGGLGSFLRLFNPQGQELAFNNDAAAPGENTVGFDAYLRLTFAAAGTFYIGVSNAKNTLYDPVTGSGDAAGGPNSIGSYQLTVQTAPADPGDTDDSLNEATFLGAISTIPNTTNAEITPDIDVDLYRFTVTAGQTVDFDIDTTLNGPGGLGSFLRLFGAQGQELAVNDNAAAPGENQVGIDAYLRFTFATAGTYYVGVSNANNTLYDPVTGTGDVAGGPNSTGSYQLIVQALPVDTDDSLSEANPLGAISATPKTINAEINPDIDVDLYSFTVTSGQVVDFDIDTPLNGPGGLGSFLRLFNEQGQELAFNNNGAAPGENTVGFDAYLRFTFAAAGTFYIGVSNANNTLYDPLTGNGDAADGQNSIGSYQLIVQAVPASVATLNVRINALSIPESGTAIGTVTRASAEVSQSLTVTLSSSDTTEATVPATVVIPANQTSVDFTISALDDQVVDGAQTVTITATAAGFVDGAQSLRVTDSSGLWHNVQNPLDVNNNGTITVNDAFLIVNYLNRFGTGPVPQEGSPPPYYDVNSDDFVTASDALIVINYLNGLLNQQSAATAPSESPSNEGRAASSSALSTGLASAADALMISPTDRPSVSSSRSFLRARWSTVSVDDYFAEIESRRDARAGA